MLSTITICVDRDVYVWHCLLECPETLSHLINNPIAVWPDHPSPKNQNAVQHLMPVNRENVPRSDLLRDIGHYVDPSRQPNGITNHNRPGNVPWA